MTKKRTWETSEMGRRTMPVKVCNTAKESCKCKDKVTVSKEALEDWRISRNELLKELEEAKEVLRMRKDKIDELETKYLEQDNIIKDMFDDMVELSDKVYWYKLWRNVSIAFNVIFIILLVLFAL